MRVRIVCALWGEVHESAEADRWMISNAARLAGA
jgi:hypothetical protein